MNSEEGPASVVGTIEVTSNARIEIRDLFDDVSNGRGYPLGATVGRSYSAEHTAYGRLTISDGADLRLAPVAVFVEGAGVYGGYDTLNTGIGEGGTGRVEVRGVGSSLATEGTNPLIRIGGAGGTGTLAITEGAKGQIFALQAGFGVSAGSKARGRIVVSGQDSRLELGTAGAYIRPGYTQQAGTTTIGLAFSSATTEATGRGYLDITDGGEMIVENIADQTSFPLLRFGRDELSYGVGLVDGSASRLAVVQHGAVGEASMGGATLDVGEAGQGVLRVRNGGSVDVLGDRALLAISRPGSDQPTTSQTSSLIIENGGTVRVDAGSYQGGHLLVASGSDAVGTMDISGQGSALFLASNAGGPEESDTYGAALKIGVGGHGVVTVRDSGSIQIDGQNDPRTGITVAEDGGTGSLTLDDGTLTITGTGAGSDTAGIKVGNDLGSSGEIIVENGGSVTLDAANGTIEVATAEGSEGSLKVSGSGSSVKGGSLALIGASGPSNTGSGGEAELILEDGGSLSVGTVVIGKTGRLELSGGRLDADLTLGGVLDLSPGSVTSETLSGDAILSPGAIIALDAHGFAAGPADYLSLLSNDPVDFSNVELAVSIDRTTAFFAGDNFVFAGLAADQPSRSYYSFEVNSGRPLKITVENQTARIEAILGSSASVRDDGTLKSIELPSFAQALARGVIHGNAEDVVGQRYQLETTIETEDPPWVWEGESIFDF